MKNYTWITIAAAVVIFITGCKTPDTWEMSQWYTQLSRYRDSELRAFSIYVKVLEEEKIEKICDYYFDQYAESDRYMQIDFYDSRDFTPDYTNGVEVNEYQAQHRVAQFYYNPFRNDKRLEFFQ